MARTRIEFYSFYRYIDNSSRGRSPLRFPTSVRHSTVRLLYDYCTINLSTSDVQQFLLTLRINTS